ncbi:hypothetical protein SO802_001271 [Lithocarpus litseifolius]|uniref:DDE Tnp4 domain-containing protein n=1 Tax=Lithocarpus litseifolius TaxID=425828 RepID=A0AAW2DUE7_9ROSI
MFLYIIGHNTRMRCVANMFQHLTETISRHFRKVLRAVHSYAKHLIKLDPNVDGLLEHLQVNKYWPWFEKCVGAIDGTRVSARPPSNVTQAYRSHKSNFTYVHAGWEGSANDSRVLDKAISDSKHGFPWPPTGSYYLVDSGFPIGTSFLPSHKSTRYHAQEFRSSNRQPSTKKELYNYRHSSLRMVIEQSFGMLKAHFPILNLMPIFKRTRQHYVIVVCYAFHNFLRMNNRGDELFRTWASTWVKGTSSSGLPSHNTEASSSTAT